MSERLPFGVLYQETSHGEARGLASLMVMTSRAFRTVTVRKGSPRDFILDLTSNHNVQSQHERIYLQFDLILETNPRKIIENCWTENYY
jgi:hypothetical protein